MNKNMRNNCVGFVVFGAWSIIFLVGFLMWSISPTKVKREALIAGYFPNGNTENYRFVLFPDSTYLLSYGKLGDSKGCRWFTENDTIKLLHRDRVCATFYEGKYAQYYCDEFRCLSIMNFREFNPAKEIEF